MLWKQRNFTTTMKFRVNSTLFRNQIQLLMVQLYFDIHRILNRQIHFINSSDIANQYKLTNTTAATASPILLHVSLQMALNGIPLLSFQ